MIYVYNKYNIHNFWLTKNKKIEMQMTTTQ